MKNQLNLQTIRQANLARLPLFKNSKGEVCHTKPDGSDWKLSQWGNALAGETGEACNIIKKIERGDYTIEQGREALGKELADILTYLDLLALNAGVDLADAYEAKFNEVSKRVGVHVFINNNGVII